MKKILIALASVSVAALVILPSAAKDKKPMADEFSGVFISMNAPGAMGKPVSIWIESYTTDEVAQSLVATLEQKGQDVLVNELPNTRAGTIRIGTSDGYQISVARQRATPDGRIVFLVSNRPFVGMTQGGPAAATHPIGVIELRLKTDGTGEGTIIGAARLAIDDKKNLTVASEASQPGRISDVKTKAKPAN